FMTSHSSELDMSPSEFREVGHELVEAIADFYASLPSRPVTPAETPAQIRELIGIRPLPEDGASAQALLRAAAPLLFDHSLHNGHPRFLGYISSSAAPLGALADLLAASVNANVVKWDLSPVASEIESQTIRWIAELIGYPADCGGIMVSGGNAANFLGFVAARKARVPWDIRDAGVYADSRRLTAYVSRETHTWIDKAADVAGLGAGAVRWIDADGAQRLDVDALRKQIHADRRAGRLPFLVVATAGTTSTGAIDPLPEIAAVCREENLWLHLDGAYGAPAAALSEAPSELRALAQADSVALDPHKWLYSPIEAGCVLTKDARALSDALSFEPSYYDSAEEAVSGIDFFQHGMQNTRGFRALKVWLTLQQAGRAGIRRMIRNDIALAKRLFERAKERPDLEARTRSLSVTTFRYVPEDLRDRAGENRAYLDALNKALLSDIQKGGNAFLSNAIVDGDYLLRACFVNFRTRESDVDRVLELVSSKGRELDARMRKPDCSGVAPEGRPSQLRAAARGPGIGPPFELSI
ncbi:MAG TPA: aminotransferase class V-fold PLP-dependent enzyme, partial [Gammaproteobacteria bacterium]